LIFDTTFIINQLPWRRSIDPITDPNLNGERMYSAKKIQFEKKNQTKKRKVKKNFSDWKISQPEKRKNFKNKYLEKK
jgi:hypothetical protein